jgi:hypothetical protein
MPAIIVQSNGTTEQDTNVLLYEDVQPDHLASDHHAAQLIERVGWAVTDAKETEVEEESGR